MIKKALIIIFIFCIFFIPNISFAETSSDELNMVKDLSSSFKDLSYRCQVNITYIAIND